ncbi:hypothetical protein AALP_AA3G152700 [Arabis alpina]|uniref:FHA domain-containing protein n=1 Tax=Arabis alpina TaxID=50452 RepID=A0A087H9C6_ARAAL|nr:hypothetical protein AALP_AA3G152700 [Arabis alpina]
MEIEGEDGTKLSLNPGVKTVIGRGSGFNSKGLTVSRRHVSLELKPAASQTGFSDLVFFKVLGRNPVWVRVGEKIRTYRKSETGEISTGDRFCLSGYLPVWFDLKRRGEVTEERVSDGESGLDCIDFSHVDPVKEFGFLVIGKEFDQYSKSRMRDVKQWEWFLEDSTNGNSDDDEDGGDKKGRKGLSKKRRRKKGNEDDDWSVESEEDKEMMVKAKRVVNPTYSTRSKKSKKDTNASSSSSIAQAKPRGRVDVDDEDDETLGGFIVSDEEDKLEEEDEVSTDDEEEEEDCDEDEDEDEDEE